MKMRDNKGRILRNGETQEKSGRYVYTYYESGEQRKLYSWRLEPTDPLPYGKRECVALRKQSEKIERLRYLGIMPDSMTVLELVELYTETRNNVRPSTLAGYTTVKNLLKKEAFGSKKITQVKKTDAKLWLISLQKNGRRYCTVRTIRGVLRPAFELAVEDDTIFRNPFDFPLSSVVVNDSLTRDALTPQQERNFLSFVKNDSHFNKYYDVIYLLFNTGMRISEFCGLTIRDVNLRTREIRIDHQLVRVGMVYLIEPPKTDAGIRTLPMTDDVYECCKNILANRPRLKTEPAVNGYSGFLTFAKNGRPTVALHWEKYFNHIVAKYNNTYKVQMPNVTPHVCRHTYCSNMARKRVSPKTLQYLMGHSDISVTLNTYTHLKYEDARDEIRLLDKDDRFKKVAL